jgi:hypothetical protein
MENVIIMKKIVRIDESSYNRLFILENREDQARDRSLQVFREYFGRTMPYWNVDDIFNHPDNPDRLSNLNYMFKCFEEIFYHDPKLRASQIMRLEPAFIKIAFDNGFQQGNANTKIMNRLRRIEWKMYYLCKSDKQEANFITKITDLSTFTFDFLNNRYGPLIDQDDAEEEERINTTQLNQKGEYKIIGPIDFRLAHRLGEYTGKAARYFDENGKDGEIYYKKKAKHDENQAKKAAEAAVPGETFEQKDFKTFGEWAKDQAKASKMCYTMFKGTWEDYADADLNRHIQNNNVYVILRDDWQNIPSIHDDNGYSAYDTYGLSMIWVIVDDEGGLQYCNTRWNHAAEYAEGRTVDFALTREEISDIIGRNFMNSFKGKREHPEPYHEVDIEALLDEVNTGADNEEVEQAGGYQTTTDPHTVEECMNVIRAYFRRTRPGFNLDATFNNTDNHYNLTIIDYIFQQFEEAFFNNDELKASDFGKHSEPIFLRFALENRFQQVNNPSDSLIERWNRISKFIWYLYHLAEAGVEESEFAQNLPYDISFNELENRYGAEVDAEDWGY